MRSVAIIIGVLALVGCNGSFENRFAETSHKTLSAAGVKTLEVRNVAGRVRIEGSNRRDLDIAIVKHARSPETLARTHVTAETKDGVVTIVTRIDDVESNVNVDVTIEAPASLAVRVANTAGTTRIDNVTSDVQASSQAGTIDVTLEHLGGSQNIDLSSTAGTVALTIPKNSDANVSAQTTVGAFHSDFPSIVASRANIVGESGGGTIGTGSAKVSLRTTTGAIDLNSH